jgi:myo-inositol-1(or 4)-monophosphatase
MPQDLSGILADAIRAARLGGAIDRHHFGTIAPGHATEKEPDSDWNPVTEVDRAAETAITDHLRQAYPDHHFLGEENVTGGGTDGDHLWVIDPIDGTANYIHGMPHYGVAVGYAYQGTILAAACLDPERDELFTAIRGEGAWLNGSPIRSRPTSELKDALVATGFYYDRGRMMERTLDAIRRLFEARIHGIRRTGSAVLDICWTAAGRFDAFFEYQLGPWDYAAASLIAEEAGATITAVDGTPLTLESGNVACAAAPLHARLLSVIGS